MRVIDHRRCDREQLAGAFEAGPSGAPGQQAIMTDKRGRETRVEPMPPAKLPRYTPIITEDAKAYPESAMA